MNRKSLVAGLGLVVFGLSARVAHAAPLFPQCPHVGAAFSCQLLITINPGGSLSFQSDSTVGPYDTFDDTLVGVVNQSGSLQSSISLTGPGIFGFDHDGAGNMLSPPGFGTTGYEGPNTNFAINDVNHGDVLLLNGLANGDSRWFSLENLPFIPTAGINKDLQNGTGQVADEIQIVLAGAQDVASHYDGPGANQPGQPAITFASFSHSVSGGNTVLDWKTPSALVQPGYITHVGFTIHADTASILSVAWYRDGAKIGCAHQVDTNTHLLGDANATVTFSNDVTGCENIPMFVGQMAINWYVKPLDIASLRPDLLPQPIRTDTINTPALSIQPGAKKTFLLSTAGPDNAGAGVLVYAVGSDSSLGNGATHDVVQFMSFPAKALIGFGGCVTNSDCPTHEACQSGVCVGIPGPSVPATPPWGVGILVLILGASGLGFLKRFGRQRG
jgi:hypothetical protein